MQHLSWCYVSTATPAFDPARLDDLYAQGRAFNAPRRVSGVLLFCNGRFCQLIEGPAASMEEVIGRVQSSSLHTDLLTLHREPITLPVFPSWSLGTASDWRGQRMPHDLDSGRFGRIRFVGFRRGLGVSFGGRFLGLGRRRPPGASAVES